jgi:cell division protein FtsA
MDQQMVNISNDRQIDKMRLLSIIEARQQEILENVWEQVKNYSDRLLSGIIFTGGAANMRQLETAFIKYHHFDKVKTRLMPAVAEFSTNLRLDPQTTTLATLIAMLRRGDEACTTERPIEPGLFDPTREEPVIPITSTKEEGVVMQPKPEQPEETTPPEQPEEPQPEKPKKEKKGPGAFSKVGAWFKNLANDLVEEK